MVGVGGRPVAGDLAENGGAAGGGRLGLLEHQHAGALAHDEAVATQVERTRDPGRRQRLHRVNDANANSVSVASEPPHTTASASPYWIMRSAEPTAWAPLAQAETTP